MSGFTGSQCNETVVDTNELKGATLGILIAVVVYIPISSVCIFILANAISSVKDQLHRQDKKIYKAANSSLKRATSAAAGHPPYAYYSNYVMPVNRGQKAHQANYY